MMATVLVLMSNTHPESKSAREITVRDNIQQSSVSNDPTVEVFYFVRQIFTIRGPTSVKLQPRIYNGDCNWN